MEDTLRSLIRNVILEYDEDVGSLSPGIRLTRLIKRLIKKTKDAQEISDYIGQYYAHLFYEFGPNRIKATVNDLLQRG